MASHTICISIDEETMSFLNQNRDLKPSKEFRKHIRQVMEESNMQLQPLAVRFQQLKGKLEQLMRWKSERGLEADFIEWMQKQ